VSQALDAHGRIDGVVNAAGVVAFGDLVDTDPVVLEELFLVNTLGALWLAQAAIPSLRATRGFLLHVSAVVAEHPLPGLVGYSASKAALTGADQALRRELRRHGVSVVDARPPHTETGLAGRPAAGTAPRLPPGLDPGAVAARLVAAIEADEGGVPSGAFDP
jgi:cyclic-di-GMP-binding biofilm dispersal mediator protein